jgi:hypothetical protein
MHVHLDLTGRAGEGGFAAAGFADHGERFAAGDLQVDAIQRAHHRAIVPHEVV